MKRILIQIVPILLLAACSSPEIAAEAVAEVDLEATAQRIAQTSIAITQAAQPTATQPPPTATPEPTATTLPTETATMIPSPTSPPPTATPTTSPANVKNSLRTYYVNTDENGPIDCGDKLISIRIGVARTGDPATDVGFALSGLFSVHQPYVLGLYNAYGSVGSAFSVDEVTYDANANKLEVFISGRYHRNDQPRCENLRVHRQIAQTVKNAAPGVSFDLWINGQTIKDVLLGD